MPKPSGTASQERVLVLIMSAPSSCAGFMEERPRLMFWQRLIPFQALVRRPCSMGALFRTRVFYFPRALLLGGPLEIKPGTYSKFSNVKRLNPYHLVIMHHIPGATPQEHPNITLICQAQDPQNPKTLNPQPQTLNPHP